MCAPIFAAYWGLSKASLERYVKEAKGLLGGVYRGDVALRKPREAIKYNYIVAWVLQYAECVTEKLPDCNKLCIHQAAPPLEKV